MSLVRHRLSHEASAPGESIRSVKEQPKGDRNKYQSYFRKASAQYGGEDQRRYRLKRGKRLLAP
jgi:hypothetical protein